MDQSLSATPRAAEAPLHAEEGEEDETDAARVRGRREARCHPRVRGTNQADVGGREDG